MKKAILKNLSLALELVCWSFWGMFIYTFIFIFILPEIFFSQIRWKGVLGYTYLSYIPLVLLGYFILYAIVISCVKKYNKITLEAKILSVVLGISYLFLFVYPLQLTSL